MRDFSKLYPLLRDSSLREKEGVECNSPRELFRNGYVDEGKLRRLFEMVDDRNLTVHTYNEEVAERLFRKLKEYEDLMRSTVGRLEL